jgi:Caspase domain
MDELIVTYDNDLIRDDELRQMLVGPLPAGVKLTAVFDSCHSASLLGESLCFYRCVQDGLRGKLFGLVVAMGFGRGSGMRKTGALTLLLQTSNTLDVTESGCRGRTRAGGGV